MRGIRVHGETTGEEMLRLIAGQEEWTSARPTELSSWKSRDSHCSAVYATQKSRLFSILFFN